MGKKGFHFDFIWVSFLFLFCGAYELQHGNTHKTWVFGQHILDIISCLILWKYPLLNAAESWSCWDMFGNQAKWCGEWCHFTPNRHIHAADKGSLIFTVCWGHQPFRTVTFNRIKRGKINGLFQISWRYYKKSSCSSQILFVFRVKGLCTEPVWFSQEEQEVCILFQHLW